jgi:hypothetical protein
MKVFKKALLAVALFALVSNSMQGQEDSKFLFERSKSKVTTFFAEVYPYTSWSSLNKQNTSVFEFAGGFMINDKFTISFFSASTPKLSPVAIPTEGSTELNKWIEAGVELDKVGSSTEFLLFSANRQKGC